VRGAGNGTIVSPFPVRSHARSSTDYDRQVYCWGLRYGDPAPVRPETARRLKGLSASGLQAIDAAGMASCRFLVSPDESEIYINEINTIPGFTAR